MNLWRSSGWNATDNTTSHRIVTGDGSVWLRSQPLPINSQVLIAPGTSPENILMSFSTKKVMMSVYEYCAGNDDV